MVNDREREGGEWERERICLFAFHVLIRSFVYPNRKKCNNETCGILCGTQLVRRWAMGYGTVGSGLCNFHAEISFVQPYHFSVFRHTTTLNKGSFIL